MLFRSDELAASLPTNIDGGIATAAILGIMSIFAESAGELTSALAGFGELVTESATRYEQQDIYTADQINLLAWTADE